LGLLIQTRYLKRGEVENNHVNYELLPARVEKSEVEIKPTSTQIAMPSISNQVDSDGRGVDALLEYKIIKPMILDGSFFRVEKKVGTLSVQRVIKSFSDTGATVGTKKAAKVVELALADRLPMTKVDSDNLLGVGK
jgi:hypothetical protein